MMSSVLVTLVIKAEVIVWYPVLCGYKFIRTVTHFKWTYSVSYTRTEFWKQNRTPPCPHFSHQKIKKSFYKMINSLIITRFFDVLRGRESLLLYNVRFVFLHAPCQFVSISYINVISRLDKHKEGNVISIIAIDISWLRNSSTLTCSQIPSIDSIRNTRSTIERWFAQNRPSPHPWN